MERSIAASHAEAAQLAEHLPHAHSLATDDVPPDTIARSIAAALGHT